MDTGKKVENKNKQKYPIPRKRGTLKQQIKATVETNMCIVCTYYVQFTIN